jgi:4-amino-4-deoxy-L-arabinose transferase-like glycosyltransferase
MTGILPLPEPSSRRVWSRLAVLLPVALTALLYLSTTFGRAVIDQDDGLNAQVAVHMAEQGDWVTPSANGVRSLERPPFMFWLTAVSIKVFGATEFALRLPPALGVIALVWVVMLIARRAGDERAAIIAGLCTASCAGTYLFTRETVHDIWLVLFVTIAMYAFFEWYLDPRRSISKALLFYAAMAGAVLCKSLIGIAFPVGIIALFYLLKREWPEWRKLHILPGACLFLVLAVPWHWLAAVRNPGFLWYFFVDEQFLRFLGMRELPVVWSVPLLLFWALIPVWFFPWTAFLPAALMAWRKPADSVQRSLMLLSLAWVAVILGFFSVSARLEHYAFPVLPALSILVAVALSRPEESRSVQWAFRGLAILGGVVLAAGIGVGIWFVAAGHDFESAPAKTTGTAYDSDFSILAEMPAEIQWNLLKPAAVTALALAIGFWAALRFETRRRRMRAVMSVAAAMMVVCGMIHWSLIICEDMISSKKLALAIAREARPGDRLVVMGDYESANSLNFYQPLRVEVVDGVAYFLIPGMKYPDAPRVVMTREEFAAAWRAGTRVFALVPLARLADLDPGGVEVLRVSDRVLVRNH